MVHHKTSRCNRDLGSCQKINHGFLHTYIKVNSCWFIRPFRSIGMCFNRAIVSVRNEWWKLSGGDVEWHSVKLAKTDCIGTTIKMKNYHLDTIYILH
jgi:hypothetical protein